VIRGLHLQIKKPQGKFITVLRGKIFDVVVDCRIKSKTFGKYFSIILSEKKNVSLYIPEGFAHGFCSLSESSLIHYKMTNYRNNRYEKGILWNDKSIKIKWPVKKPIISIKDKKNITFGEYIKIL
jgi:dTDP-4-dehydrorhamnose 3,5-epimerase